MWRETLAAFVALVFVIGVTLTLAYLTFAPLMR